MCVGGVGGGGGGEGGYLYLTLHCHHQNDSLHGPTVLLLMHCYIRNQFCLKAVRRAAFGTVTVFH